MIDVVQLQMDGTLQLHPIYLITVRVWTLRAPVTLCDMG